MRLAADRAVWRELVVAALPLGLTLAVNELYFRADTFILSLSRPAAEVGHYTLAYRVYELLALIPAVVMTTVFPLLSRRLAEDREAAERTLRATARAFWTLGVPLAAGGLVLAPELARLVGGDEFAAAADPLRLLLCAAALAYLSRAARLRADRRRPAARDAVAVVVALVANLALNVALVPAYGADAAAAVALGMRGAPARRRLAARAPPARAARGSRTAVAPVVAAAVMAGVVWPLRERTPALTVPLGVARLRRSCCGRAAASTAGRWRRCAR